MTAETNSLSPAWFGRGLWLRLRPCQYKLIEPVRRFGEAEEVSGDRILSGHVLCAAVTDANRRRDDDVAAVAADIDVRIFQSAGLLVTGRSASHLNTMWYPPRGVTSVCVAA